MSSALADFAGPEITDFADLDALLADSMQAKQDAIRIKEIRKKRAGGGMLPHESLVASAKIREWDLKREWNPSADVAFFHTQHCASCGSAHTHFTGIYQKQRHRTLAIDRWIKSDSVSNKGLPKEVKNEDENVPLCSDCTTSSGWSFN